ncbi:D-glycero-alpha-D-manno-heptose-1,7-bisphosphate 7-phosphatase [Streptomyces coeruleorubidus]|uniref:D-glycero-alpha-D-manno-heptose-1,7-bisphosphate 7-phosphatase n=1 Tax=Streptomyces coeruleorubidus TaxID=116188 RepID=UPI0033FFC46C
MNRPTGPWLLSGPYGSTGVRQPPHAHDRGGAFPAAVLFDRDGTLVSDVPYNGDPARVTLMPRAREAVDAVRAAGIPVGVVTNQSGVARGLLTPRQIEDVRLRVEELLGPFAVWAVCPHGPGEGCGCRKPAPGLVLAACRRLAVPPERTVVIGDIGADVEAARAAGARGVLVPTAATRPEEITVAGTTAAHLLAAVRLVLDPAADLLAAVRLVLDPAPVAAPAGEPRRHPGAAAGEWRSSPAGPVGEPRRHRAAPAAAPRGHPALPTGEAR